MEIQIGADEIILWLRKNGKCQNESNFNLGKKILNLILKHGGQKNIDNQQSYWHIGDGATHVDEWQLPATAEQYLIPLKSIQAIYDEFVKW